MGFLALVNAYTMRITLSVAITEMVKRVNNTHEDLDTCPDDFDEGGGSGVSTRNKKKKTFVFTRKRNKFRFHSLIQPIHSGTYEWSQELQGVILSSFYWGYAITHLPGGLLGMKSLKTNFLFVCFNSMLQTLVINRVHYLYLAEKFGGKYTLGLGILSTAIFTLLTPVCVEWGEKMIAKKKKSFKKMKIYEICFVFLK